MSHVSYTPRPGAAQRSTSFVFDTNTLDNLRREVGGAGQGAEKAEMEVAKQFEALFIQMMLKQSRAAALPGGLFDSSDQSKMIQSMHDEQMALDLAQGKGMGLAHSIHALMQSNKSDPVSEINTAVNAAKASPELKGSRIAGLTSEMPLDKAVVADSLDDLIALVTKAAHATKRTIQGAVSVVNKILPADSAPKQVAEFIEKVGDAAVKVAQTSGVPIHLMVSQAALESGWGNREIKHPDGQSSHNLFGIKATSGWKGKVVHVMTTGYVDGTPRKMSQPFRAYDSYEASLADYARLISTSDRYKPVMQAQTVEQAAQAVQSSGYATDPKYAQKLISIMNHFKTA